MPYDPDARRDTPLARGLKERIRREGPISVAAYMGACLTDPEHGYYVTQPAIGRAGDFITAPEISQVFGELIGLWCAVAWQQMGSPPRLTLVELGPGRGTLMRDALRAARLVPAFFEAIAVHLVETSRPLAAVQQATLSDAGRPIAWHGALDAVPSGPTLVVANEFLDTVAVSQSLRHGGEWVERGVGLDENDRLVFRPMAGPGPRNDGFRNAGEGSILESRGRFAILEVLRDRAGRAPLAALFLDYGHVETGVGDTLQAVRSHAAEHPLTSPGEADLTAQVDFAEFGRQAAASSLGVDGPITQGAFLGRLGIVERASRLMSANPAKAGQIEMGVARLIAPQGMGSRFKAIGVRSSGLPPLPGFEQSPLPPGAARGLG